MYLGKRACFASDLAVYELYHHHLEAGDGGWSRREGGHGGWPGRKGGRGAKTED